MTNYCNDLFGYIQQWVDRVETFAHSAPTPVEMEVRLDRETWNWLVGISSEVSYRQYAALINHSRPHRKISWRHLNRRQRSRAVELFPGVMAAVSEDTKESVS